jgi:photosystem II stability/assembly factor-like uncharacterized protein
MELPDVPTRALLLALLLSFWSSPVRAHDPSAWGGLFRSRDQGASWFLANPVWFVGGAIALAISPVDPNHLLLGTDSGLLRSRNGGRDWGREGTTLLIGPVFAVAFDANGQRALVSTGSGIFRTDDGNSWRKTSAPEGAAPARAILRGAVAGRVYLAGRSGLLRSDNWGATWSSYAGGLPEGPVTAFLVVGGSPEIVYRIVGGRIWARTDGADVWVNRTVGAAVINVDALVVDQALPTRIWAAGADQLFRSEDQGVRWRAVGRPLPERNTMVRGIAAAGGTIVLTTDRGLYRSADSGERWALLADNLPAHLEAGPLVRDPVDPDTLYAGFALTPYAEIWRRAAEGGNSLRRLSLSSLAGSAAFLTLVALSAVVALRWLRHYYHVPSGPRRHGRGGRAAR